MYLAKLRGLSAKEAKAGTEKWLKRLQVDNYIDKKLETLSKGNQQKVQLAQTLVCNPDIVILDEPFSGLDPVNSQVLKDVIQEIIREGKIVIFSSHQMSYVEEFCEDIVIIHHGEVVLGGKLGEIRREKGKGRLEVSCMDKKPEELAPVLKSLKNTGGSAYSDMIGVLDASLDAIEKSGTFSEIGKRGESAVDGAWGKIEAAAQEIMKGKPDMRYADAIDAACIAHPELVQEYEKSRR